MNNYFLNALGQGSHRAITLLSKMTAAGLKPSKEVAAAQKATETASALRQSIEGEIKALDDSMPGIVIRGDRQEIMEAATELDALKSTLEALRTDTVLGRLTTDETTAIDKMAADSRPRLEKMFNTHATAWLDLYRNTFGGGELRAVNVLSSPAASQWSTFTDLAMQMNSIAGFLDSLDGVNHNAPITRYGRNIAHPDAGEHRLRDAYFDSTSPNWDYGWDWLGAAEVQPMARWIVIATAEAMPEKTTYIAFDREAQARDDAAHERARRGDEATKKAAVTPKSDQFTVHVFGGPGAW